MSAASERGGHANSRTPAGREAAPPRRALILIAAIAVVAGCAGAPRPTDDAIEAAPPALSTEAATRVWILPHLPREWRAWTDPTFLGRTADGKDLRAIGGLRFTVGQEGVTVAPEALPAEVAAAGHLSDGLWLFLLTDGHLWRSSGPLGELEALGTAATPQRMRELRPTLAVAQNGPLTVAGRGNAFASWGDWPPRRLDTLPIGIALQILSVSDDELYVLLSGGRLVHSADRGATWETQWHSNSCFTQMRVVEGQVRVALEHLELGDARWADAQSIASVPLPHAPPSPVALARAVVQAYPRAAHAIGVLLADGGSALLMDEQDVLIARADRRVEVSWGAVEPGMALLPWRGGVLAAFAGPETARRSTRDGTSWTPTDSLVRWAFDDPQGDLQCDSRIRRDVLCGEALFPPGDRSTWTTPDAERFRVGRADGSLTVTRVDAASSSGEALAQLPVGEGRRAQLTQAGDGGPMIIAEGSYWAANGSSGTLPEGTRTAVALVGGAVLAWDDDAASLQIRRGDESWEPIAAGASGLFLMGYQVTCAGSRCVFWHPHSPTVLVEVGERVEAMRERVARNPSDRYAVWNLPGSRAASDERRPNGFGHLDLRCDLSPAPPPDTLAEVQVERHSFRWGRSRSRRHEDLERLVSHAVGTRERLFALLGDEVYSVRDGQPPVRWDWGVYGAARSFDAVAEGDRWSVMQMLDRDATYVVEIENGGISSFTLRSQRPCYGLGRRGGVWGAVVCGQAHGRGAFYEVAGFAAQIPTSVRLPIFGDGPLPLCASPHEDRLRLRVTVGASGWERSATAVFDQVEGGSPCVRALELWGDAEASAWHGAGRLDVSGDRLVGTMRANGPAWQRASCELIGSGVRP